ncbi:MAG: carbonate dehydratase [Thiolinea sp.]
MQHLLDKNKAWADAVVAEDPDFFTRLSKQQRPELLWIGCADSRVPANQILDLPPGEVFVHRNIANLVVHTDLSCLSVIQFAVEVLEVKHIVVCGHYGCGGVRAAMENQELGQIDNWLRHIKDVARFNADRLSGLPDDERHDLLCELNVMEQVANVCNTSMVRRAWRSGRELLVHGLIYDIRNGILQDLEVTTSAYKQLDAKFRNV